MQGYAFNSALLGSLDNAQPITTVDVIAPTHRATAYVRKADVATEVGGSRPSVHNLAKTCPHATSIRYASSRVNARCVVKCAIDAEMANPHARLAQARARAGYEGPADVARVFGWNESTYRGHENGSRGIKREAAIKYARAFSVTPEWILLGTGETTELDQIYQRLLPSRLAPMMELIDMTSIDVNKIDTGGKEFISIARGDKLGQNIVCVTVVDDSMRSRSGGLDGFAPGDILVIDLSAPINPGDYVIAAMAGESAVIRRYQSRGRATNGTAIIDLMPLNPDYATLRIDEHSPGRIIGRVAQRIQTY